MRLAITGCNGSVGKRVVLAALNAGHTVIGIDHPNSARPADVNAAFTFVAVDLLDYDKTKEALKGAEGVIQLAARRNPGDYLVETHNTYGHFILHRDIWLTGCPTIAFRNVVISWNVLRSAAELGITRIAQASSVNVVTLVYSLQPKFDYLPLDEDHPCLPDEPYGLSKVICELQADTIVRRFPNTRIASLRLSWSLPNPAIANQAQDPVRRRNDLWGYVQEDSGAEAFLLAVTQTDEEAKWSGHEAFFIAAPETTQNEESKLLKEKYWPDVPLKRGVKLEGRMGFFDCGKAKRLLGWVHRAPED